MKLITIFAITMLCLFLVGCTTKEYITSIPNENVENNIATNNANTQNQEQDTNIKAPEEVTTTDFDIIIIDGRIDPDQITVPIDKTTTITVHNKEDKERRFSIPMYQSDVSVDIPADGKEIVSITPKFVGSTTIELNGNNAGTIITK